MKDLSTTEPEEIETDTPETTADDLDALLSTYNKSLTVDAFAHNDESEPEQTNNAPVNVPLPDSPPESVWRGNPAYFQSGNKAGKLRPSMKHKAPAKEQMEISGTLIDGAMFIMLIDILFPLAITALNNKLTKSKINFEDIQLNEKQKRDLSPIADEVVKKLSLAANPVWLMVIAMGGIYGINFMAAKQDAERKLKK